MIYYNGELMDEAPIFEFQDRLRLGDGVFDTMLVIEGKPIHEDTHFLRLLENAKTMRMDLLPDLDTLKNAAAKIIESNESYSGRFALNTLITRGIAERGLAPDKNVAPNIAMRISAIPDEFPLISAIISKTVQRNEGSSLSQIKSCNYGDNILALIEAQDKGANEAILLNNKGLVTCASAGNIFCCINDELITPPLSDGVMDGVTRKILIEKFAVKERSITEDDLKNAAGIYITNSIKGIMPVTSLNGKILPEASIKINKDAHLDDE